jgi:hypothetical protein
MQPRREYKGGRKAKTGRHGKKELQGRRVVNITESGIKAKITDRQKQAEKRRHTCRKR